MTFLSSFLFSLTLIIVIVLLLSLITLLTFSPGLYSLHLLAVRLQHAISGPSSSSSCKSISSAALVTASSPTTGEVEIPYLDSTSGYSTTSHRLKPVSKTGPSRWPVLTTFLATSDSIIRSLPFLPTTTTWSRDAIPTPSSDHIRKSEGTDGIETTFLAWTEGWISSSPGSGSATSFALYLFPTPISGT
jgi:hypothetical protein